MERSARTPVHLWVVGVLSTLWNGFGAVDYTMTQLRAEAWMAKMTPDQVAWLESAPLVAHAGWAFGVWGALIGSLLLLARSRHAVIAFSLSLAGLAANTVYRVAAPMPSGHMDSTAAIALHAAIWVVAVALLVYALRMRRWGVLR